MVGIGIAVAVVTAMPVITTVAIVTAAPVSTMVPRVITGRIVNRRSVITIIVRRRTVITGVIPSVVRAWAVIASAHANPHAYMHSRVGLAGKAQYRH